MKDNLQTAKQWGEGFALVQSATKILGEVIGHSADSVSVSWDRVRNGRGRTMYTLRISDSFGEESASFTPAELESPSHLRSRFLSLWGDLLQARSDAQVKKLLHLVDAQLVEQGE
jgi:hypothetical protein